MTPHGDGRKPPSIPPSHERTHELGFELPPPARLSRAGVMVATFGAVVVLGVAFALGYLPRHRERVALEQGAQSAADALLRVSVVSPTLGTSDRAVLLPGSVEPLQETVLYARASGFVRRWLVDMGDKVSAGQLLAEIESPELDQELDQARAQLAQAQPSLQRSNASRELSSANLHRYKELAPVGLASQADLEERQAQAQIDEADVNVARATIEARQANIRRLGQIKGFTRVIAPFAGTITQRWIEIGQLVTAGNSQPLYRLATLDPARVFVHVPQDVAPGVRTDVPATVTVREYPGRAFAGRIARSAGELEAATRTMTTEVRVPNGDGALIAGMYAQVAITLPSAHRVFELPATALMSDANGPRIATVDEDSKIHLLPVVVERDTGTAIQVSTGLTGNERVAKLASAELVEGKRVEVVP